MSRILFLTALLLVPQLSIAQEVDCSSSCSDGKVLVSFADGSTATCMCMDPSQGMNDDTVENGEGEANTNEPGEDV